MRAGTRSGAGVAASRLVRCSSFREQRAFVSSDGSVLTNVSYMIMNNTTNVCAAHIQGDAAPLTSKEAADERSRRKKAEGAIERHHVFVAYATLEKSASILGKLCRWRLARYVAKQGVNLLFKVGNSSLKLAHVLYPQVWLGKSKRDWASSNSSTNAQEHAPSPAGASDETGGEP